MDISDHKLAVWKDAVKRMNEEDLEFILDFPECFEPKILKLVRSRMKDMHQSEDDEEGEYIEPTLEDLVCDTLDEIGCDHHYDSDGDICLKYQDEDFFITIDKDDDFFIEINKYNWITVSMKDYNEVSRLYDAVNIVNRNGYVAVTYTKSEDNREIYVHFNATILFASFIPNLEGYLDMRLTLFLHTYKALKEKMGELYEKEYQHHSVN
jgi:hypothetical protein